MTQCKDCRFYKMTNDGPYCHRKPRPVPVSPITSKDCFEAPEPTAADPVQTKAVEAPQEKPKRRGGRPNMHPNYVDVSGVTMKWCRMCKEYRPIGEFYAKSGTPDGHAYECKKCRVEHQRKKRLESRKERPAKVEAPVVNDLNEREDQPVLGWVSHDKKTIDTYLKVPVVNVSREIDVRVNFKPGDKYVTIVIHTDDM